MLRWLRANGRPLDQFLAAVDLSFLPYIDPHQPVPLKNGIRFLGVIAGNENPDIGLRMVSEHSVRELAFIGRVALGARTPREALERVTFAIPFHSSHEVVSLQAAKDKVVIQQGWSLAIEDMELHFIHQYFTGIIHRICGYTMMPEPLFSEVHLLPHPEFGLDHIKDRIAGVFKPACDRLLRIEIPNAVADRSFFKVARERNLHKRLGEVSNLNFNGSLATSSKAVLGLQFLDGSPGIGRLACWAGVSQRTLQRRLGEEGTSFSALLEEVRKEMALDLLKTSCATMDDIAARLGYERQSTFTRAVRRWTGRTPTQVRVG